MKNDTVHGVFLGTPTTREFSAGYVSSLFLTEMAGSLAWHTIIGQAIDIGRNAVVEKFLEGDLEYLLMHDSDATWHPGAIQRLVDRKLPVVTAVIFKRSIPPVPTIGKDMGPGVKSDGSHLYSFANTLNRINEVAKREKLDPETIRNELLFPARADDIEEIDGAGSHFILIHRDVLEKIGENWFQAIGVNAGEDFAFCRNVQKAGYKLYVDYSVFTGHTIGPGFEIGIRQFLMYADHKEINTLWTA